MTAITYDRSIVLYSLPYLLPPYDRNNYYRGYYYVVTRRKKKDALSNGFFALHSFVVVERKSGIEKKRIPVAGSIFYFPAFLTMPRILLAITTLFADWALAFRCFQGFATSELGKRSGDPQTQGLCLLRLGWALPCRRSGRTSGPSTASTAVHVFEAPLRWEAMLVLR